MSDKNYSQFTLNDTPAVTLSGLLGKSQIKGKPIDTKRGPGFKTEFSIKVDLARLPDGSFSKENKYLNVTVFGDMVDQLKALQGKHFARVSVSGYYNAREEQPKTDGSGGVWPARLDFNAQRVYVELEAGEPAAVPAGEASGAVASW